MRDLPLGPLLSDGKGAAGKVLFQALAGIKKKSSLHWRGGNGSCDASHPTLCHGAEERLLLLSNHAWNAACHLGYFCYLSLSVQQC